MIVNKKQGQIQREVTSSEIDSKYRMQLQALTNIAQDGAAAQCYVCGMSIPHLQQDGKTWVIVKQHYEMTRYPEFMDTITLTTWAKRREGFFFLRDLIITSGSDAAPIVKGTSSWMILDCNTGRPLRANDYYIQNMATDETEAVPSVFSKIPLPETFTNSVDITVTMSDIDCNKHVNNTHYIKWLLASVPFEVTETHLASELDTYFIAQARLGDPVVSKTAVSNLADGIIECVHTIVNAATGTEFFRARTVWKPEQQLAQPFIPRACSAE